MAPHSFTFNFDDRRLTRAVGWTLAIVVAIELALSFAPENVMIRTMRWMRARLAQQPPATIQIHGDSVAQGGLMAGEIAGELPPGTTVWNAALQGSGPEFTYFLLKRQVEEGRRPKAIVIAHSPHTLVTERISELVGGFLDWDEVPEAMVASHRFFDTLYGILCRLSFTLRHRDELAALTKGRRAEVASWNDPIPTEGWIRSRMAAAERTWARDGKGRLPPLHPVYRQPFVVDPGEREYLARTLALARAHGITAYWLTLPEHAAVAAARDSIGFAARYYAFVDSLAARGEVRLLKRDFEVLPAENFSDYTHLREPATLRLSREVGRKLAAELTASGTPSPRSASGP
jgi:hypothetical protein